MFMKYTGEVIQLIDSTGVLNCSGKSYFFDLTKQNQHLQLGDQVTFTSVTHSCDALNVRRDTRPIAPLYMITNVKNRYVTIYHTKGELTRSYYVQRRKSWKSIL